jgi:ubiquitin-conjugating enzyme E2 J2
VQSSNTKGVGAIKAGDGGAKFRAEWPELDKENWKYMGERRIDPRTGHVVPEPGQQQLSCTPAANALRRRLTGSNSGAVVGGAQVAREAGQSWLGRNKFYIAIGLVFTYVLAARILGQGGESKA